MLKHEYTVGPHAPAAPALPVIQPGSLLFPIAFLTAGLLTDLVYWRTGDAWWAHGSAWMAGAVAASAALVTLFRLTDFLTLKRARARAGGWRLLLLNAAVLGLAATNLVLRLADPAAALPWGAGLSLLMLALYV
jgi:uncharacterized membrane protein